MNQPNYKEMTYRKLRAYVLAHRDDQEAFYTLADKFYEQPNLQLHPPLTSIEDIENYPEFLDNLRKS